MFFQKNDPVHKTMRRVVKRLDKAGIAYAVVGGMAVNAHGRKRTTADLDLLLTAEGLTEFRRRFVPKDYAEISGRPRRFYRPHEWGDDRLPRDRVVSGQAASRGRSPTPIQRRWARSSRTLAWWT